MPQLYQLVILFAVLIINLGDCSFTRKTKSPFQKASKRPSNKTPKNPHFIIIVAPHGVDRHALLHDWLASHLGISGDQHVSFDVESELMQVPAYVEGIKQTVLQSMPKDPQEWSRLWFWSEQIRSGKTPTPTSTFRSDLKHPREANPTKAASSDGSAQFSSSTPQKNTPQQTVESSSVIDSSNQSQFSTITTSNPPNVFNINRNRPNGDSSIALTDPFTPQLASLMGVCQRGEAYYSAHSPNLLVPLHGRIFEQILHHLRPAQTPPPERRTKDNRKAKKTKKDRITHLVYFHNTDIGNPNQDTEELVGMIKAAHMAKYTTVLAYVHVPNGSDLITLNYAPNARFRRFACPSTIMAESALQQAQFTSEWMDQFIGHAHYKHLDHLVLADLTKPSTQDQDQQQDRNLEFQERFHVYKRTLNKSAVAKAGRSSEYPPDVTHGDDRDEDHGGSEKATSITQWFLWSSHGPGRKATVELLPIMESSNQGFSTKGKTKPLQGTLRGAPKLPVFDMRDATSPGIADPRTGAPSNLGMGEAPYYQLNPPPQVPVSSKSGFGRRADDGGQIRMMAPVDTTVLAQPEPPPRSKDPRLTIISQVMRPAAAQLKTRASSSLLPNSTFTTSNAEAIATPSMVSSTFSSDTIQAPRTFADPTGFTTATPVNPSQPVPNITVGTASGTAILLVPPHQPSNFTRQTANAPRNSNPPLDQQGLLLQQAPRYSEQVQEADSPALPRQQSPNFVSSSAQPLDHLHQGFRVNCTDPASIWYNTSWCRPSSSNM